MESAHTNKYAALTRLNAFPAIAMAENAVRTAAAGSAEPEHALKDWVAAPKANAFHAPAKAKSAAKTNAVKIADQAADTTKCATKTRQDATLAQRSPSKTLCRRLHQILQTDSTTTLPNTLRTAATPKTISLSECTTRLMTTSNSTNFRSTPA